LDGLFLFLCIEVCNFIMAIFHQFIREGPAREAKINPSADSISHAEGSLLHEEGILVVIFCFANSVCP